MSRIIHDVDAGLAALEDAARRVEAEIRRAQGALDGLPSAQTDTGSRLVEQTRGGLGALLDACESLAAALQDGNRAHCENARALARHGEAELRQVEEAASDAREDLPLIA
ncbi:MAG: hypothetical protein FJX76_12065 [Armatimonadetes bacterium]|nr:hypothetical protein [Armatimonadota bacterium]